MKTQFRQYIPATDFLQVRDLLVHTFPLFGTLSNWRIERWNYTRYFTAAMLGDPNPAIRAANIQLWHDTIGIWQNEVGDIVGVAHSEYPTTQHKKLLGEAFFQRHPDYDSLLDEMCEYAEATFTYKNKLRFYIYEQDMALQAVVKKRGYQKNAEWSADDSCFTIPSALPQVVLPAGFKVQSMADNNDLARRAKALGLGFNHPDPQDWPSVATYTELQKAPNYRQDLDLFVVSPDGEFVSMCTMWHDVQNQVGILEPVATQPDYRRRGLGRAVITANIRRVAALGATEVWVGSSMDFYKALGFEPRHQAYVWQTTNGA